MNLEITNKPQIKELSPITINRIAAGEVVERPASVVKELVENSIDAGATEITIKIEAGGKNLILISDNGCGMSKEDLLLAIKRHTTSKLVNDDLLDIKYFGFRGEALPSIASISRMTIKSCCADSSESHMLEIAGGKVQNIIPVAHHVGTTIEVRDLFFSTPARLKFLRKEKTEIQHVQDLIKRVALANPNVMFNLSSDNKTLFNLITKKVENSLEQRVNELFHQEFIDNSIFINNRGENPVKIYGYISLPTYDRGTSAEQYLYINHRPVKDKLLNTAIRIAYKDFISRDRYPVVILFIELANELVDVNAHPAKTEVRFRDINLVRNLVIGTLKNALLAQGSSVSSTIANDTLKAANIENYNRRNQQYSPFVSGSSTSGKKNISYQSSDKKFNSSSFFSEVSTYQEPIQPDIDEIIPEFKIPTTKDFAEDRTDPVNHEYRLGAAKCQLHETYIVSQTKDSIVIIDQHAAHERLVYEQLKQQLKNGSISKQRLLIPEIIEVNNDVMDKILAAQESLQKLGIQVKNCTKQSIIVTEIPQLLGNCNTKKLIQNIVDDFIEFEENISFNELMNYILATYACHHSIRSGRIMNKDEMNALLREMENTPHSGQCNHGRPTYIELHLKDIEKLFGRR